MKSLQNISINPGNAILVIVDVQNEFCKEGGKRYSPQTSARIAPGVISAIQSLVTRARPAHIPIIYIQSVRTLQEPEFTVFHQEPHLELGSWSSQIVDELRPQEEDIVVQKFSHDAFYQTRLDEVLPKLVPDPTRCYAVVTGGAINVCVYHAVLGFYLRNYWTVVPVDGVFYSKEDGKQLALELLSWRAYPSVFLSRTDLIQVSSIPTVTRPTLIPGS